MTADATPGVEGARRPTIVVTSDLHLGITTEAEIRALVERIATEQPDLTVLAGDIGEGLSNVTACLRLFAGLPGEVAVLAGNHDLWVHPGGPSSQELWERALPDAVRAAGMLWLEDAVWRRDDVAVVGSIGWYDYSAIDPTVGPFTLEQIADYKARKFPDAFYMDWPWTDQEFATRCGDALVSLIQALEDDPSARTVFVVTHDPVFEVQMLRKPGSIGWGKTNAFFGNLTLGQRLTPFRKLRRVISGHTHIGREGEVARPEVAGAAPISAYVIPSDYHKPVHVVVQCG
jgi:predicted MPP superfamily phosphohydrolase